MPRLPLFGDRLADAVRATAPLCLGLDPHLDRLPAPLRARFEGRSGADRRKAAADAVFDFGRLAIGAARGRVAAIKPQLAFYEALGAPGMAALEALGEEARGAGLIVVADGKRGDIDSTAAAYAEALLAPDGPLGADALTVNPYMGSDTLRPYLPLCEADGRGLFVLVRTTNPGSAELQGQGQPRLADQVAALVDRLGAGTVGASGFSAIGAVVGCTAAAEALALRAAMPQAWFLVPGLGAQGGTPAEALAGARADGLGVLASSSRGLCFPGKPDAAYDRDPAGYIAQNAEALGAALRAVTARGPAA